MIVEHGAVVGRPGAAVEALGSLVVVQIEWCRIVECRRNVAVDS